MDIPKVPEAAIVVDAEASEEVWEQALEVSGFTVRRPKPDGQPAGDTVVHLLSDEDSLYVHFRAIDPEPHRVRAGYGRRDSRRLDDYVGILLDPVGDSERGVLFIANPLGVQIDGTLVRGRDQEVVPWRGSWDSWDARWQSVGRKTDDGFEVEMAIPWSSMRHPEVVDRMGITLFRQVARTAEQSVWPRLNPDIQGVLIQSAKLGGPGALPPNKKLAVMPEVTFGRTGDGPSDDRLGLEGIAPGLTLRYAPRPSTQLLATLNPDFSQVESDAARIEVNQRYSLRYEEKRPFFLEGQEWFTHPVKNLIYTRTMNTPLYGARATSEGGGWAMGAMHVWDRQPSASISEGGGWSPEDIGEGQGLETIGRIRKTMGSDAMMGLIYSNRSIVSTDMQHQLVGVDARFPISDATTVEMAGLASHTQGGPMDGTIAPAGIIRNRIRTRYVHSQVAGKILTPDFRSENGYLPKADSIGVKNRTEFILYPTWPLVPRLLLSPADGEIATDHEGELRDRSWEPNLGFWLSNGGFFILKGEHKGELFADTWLTSNRVKFIGGAPWTRWLRTWMVASTGQAPLYDPEDPRVGQAHRVMVESTIQPVPAVLVGPELGWEEFSLDGAVEYKGWVGRLKLELYAKPTLWNRWIVDQSTFTERRSIESLFAWEHAPGQAIYIGGQMAKGGLDADGEPDPNLEGSWQVFTKASWVFGG